jgi:hypothetical protein
METRKEFLEAVMRMANLRDVDELECFLLWRAARRLCPGVLRPQRQVDGTGCCLRSPLLGLREGQCIEESDRDQAAGFFRRCHAPLFRAGVRGYREEDGQSGAQIQGETLVRIS